MMVPNTCSNAGRGKEEGGALQLVVTQGHTQPPQAAAARPQLLILQPSKHQEMMCNCSTAVRRSDICPGPTAGIARGSAAQQAFLHASIVGVRVAWVMARNDS